MQFQKNPYPPHGRSLEIPKGREVLNAKILEAKYEAKLEFPGWTGVQNQKPSEGGVWIFSGTAQSQVQLLGHALKIASFYASCQL